MELHGVAWAFEEYSHTEEAKCKAQMGRWRMLSAIDAAIMIGYNVMRYNMCGISLRPVGR